MWIFIHNHDNVTNAYSKIVCASYLNKNTLHNFVKEKYNNIIGYDQCVI